MEPLTADEVERAYQGLDQALRAIKKLTEFRRGAANVEAVARLTRIINDAHVANDFTSSLFRDLGLDHLLIAQYVLQLDITENHRPS